MFASLEEEAAQAQRLLAGKVVQSVGRSTNSVVLEFTDGTRFFVSRLKDGLDLSITGGAEADD